MKHRIWRKINAQAHWLLALAVLISGLWFISPLVQGVLSGTHQLWFSQNSWREVLDAIGLAQLPRVVIALSLVLMSVGLLVRARVAWIFTLVMLLPAIFIDYYTKKTGTFPPDVIYNAVLFLLLLRYGSVYGRSSVAAGTLFALSALASLIWYAILGSLYLGQEFAPGILTLTDALYFSLVTIPTVGYGDIVPVSPTARLFVVSVILLGVTVFTTALGAIITPAAAGAFRQIMQRNSRLSMKKDHIILCGATSLALTLHQNLTARGENVTVIVKPGVAHTYPHETDLLVGDAASEEVLIQAGVKQASHVLAMTAEDADNAFIVLAAKAVEGAQARTVAVVNNNHNLEKVRTVKPDLVFSPQLLGAELLMRLLRGESLDADRIAQWFVSRGDSPEDAPSQAAGSQAS